MKALVLHKLGDLRVEETDIPVLADGEVFVAVKAAGICGSDIPRAYQTGAYSYPLILGHEFSGIVEKTGPGTDAKWQGKRVGIFPLIPCQSCLPCQNGQYEMCRHYSYLGSRRNGGFAEYAAVPAENLIELPENVSYEQAAMLEPMAVAVHAIRRAGIKESDRIAVCGLGTIGLLLVQFLCDLRKRQGMGTDGIIVIGNKDFQKQSVCAMGIGEEMYIDSRNTDVKAVLSEMTKGSGADVFFECVGKNETVAQAVNAAAPAGKIILVGNPYSNMNLEKEVYWKILRNQLTVTGTWNSSFTQSQSDDWHYVLERLAGKHISPSALITQRYPLEELIQGFQIMRDKTQDYVKIMGVM